MKVLIISSWLNFGHSTTPGRGSAAGRKILAPPYYGQCAVFASPLSTFSLALGALRYLQQRNDRNCWKIDITVVPQNLVCPLGSTWPRKSVAMLWWLPIVFLNNILLYFGVLASEGWWEARQPQGAFNGQSLVLWDCWLGDRKGFRAINSCVLVCSWWKF